MEDEKLDEFRRVGAVDDDTTRDLFSAPDHKVDVNVIRAGEGRQLEVFVKVVWQRRDDVNRTSHAWTLIETLVTATLDEDSS